MKDRKSMMETGNVLLCCTVCAITATNAATGGLMLYDVLVSY